MITEKLYKIANLLETFGWFKLASMVDKVAGTLPFKYDPNKNYLEDNEEEQQRMDDVRTPSAMVYSPSALEDMLRDLYAYEMKYYDLKRQIESGEGGYGRNPEKEYREYSQIMSHLDVVTNRLKEHMLSTVGTWLKQHTDPQEWADATFGIGKYSRYGNERDDEEEFIKSIINNKGKWEIASGIKVNLSDDVVENVFKKDNDLFKEWIEESNPEYGRENDIYSVIDEIGLDEAMKVAGVTKEQVDEYSVKNGFDDESDALATMIDEGAEGVSDADTFIRNLNPYKDYSVDEFVSDYVDDVGSCEVLQTLYDNNKIGIDDIKNALIETGYEKWKSWFNSRPSAITGWTLDEVVDNTERVLDGLKKAQTIPDKLVWIDAMINLEHYSGKFNVHMGIDQKFINELKGRRWENIGGVTQQVESKKQLLVPGIPNVNVDENEYQKYIDSYTPEKDATIPPPDWYKPTHKSQAVEGVTYMVTQDTGDVIQGYVDHGFGNPQPFSDPKRYFNAAPIDVQKAAGSKFYILKFAKDSKVTIINATPHDIDLFDKSGKKVLRTFKRDEKALIRRDEEHKDAPDIDGIKTIEISFGESDLPNEKDGVYYIVSNLISDKHTDRRDLLTPALTVRDKEGNIIGCKALGRNCGD